MSAAFQGRVVAEHAQLDAKVKRLDEFIHSAAFANLLKPDQDLLLRQVVWMTGYRGVLVERIASFNIKPHGA